MSMKTLTTFASTALLALFLTACGGNSSAREAGSSADPEDEAHEHGAGTHTHEMGADTAGTYTDTTGAFFSDDDTTDAGHEHGADTHTH
jgi:hypothetical protein